MFLLEVVPDNGLVEVACMQWSDGLFDVAWSETDANIIVSASGDGGLQLWNMSCPQVSCQQVLIGMGCQQVTDNVSYLQVIDIWVVYS